MYHQQLGLTGMCLSISYSSHLSSLSNIGSWRMITVCIVQRYWQASFHAPIRPSYPSHETTCLCRMASNVQPTGGPWPESTRSSHSCIRFIELWTLPTNNGQWHDEQCSVGFEYYMDLANGPGYVARVDVPSSHCVAGCDKRGSLFLYMRLPMPTLSGIDSFTQRPCFAKLLVNFL